MVYDLCIQPGFNIGSLICNSCVCGIQLNILYTVCDSAQCQRLLYIRIYLTVYFLAGFKGCESEVEQIVVSELRSYLRQTFDCNNIEGLCNTFSDGIDSSVSRIPVMNRSTACIIERCIVEYGCEGQSRTVKSRCIG